MSEERNELLEVENLKTTFHTVRGTVTAIDGVSFQIRQGEILGIVGESGCGKSVTSQSIMRLYDEKNLADYEGKIMFQGKDLLKLSEKEMRTIRGNKIAMIFQDALSSLNPVFTLGNQIAEAIMLHQGVSKAEAYEKAEQMLRLTGIPAPEKRIHCYPHELSGGMRQRAMIAMALCCQPQLLIADEPTTALDVTIQAQILDLIVKLNQQLDMGIMMITHDLGVVAQICQRVIIMYLGQVVEEGKVYEIFDDPKHPYTKGLIQSIPTLNTKRDELLYMIPGTVPALGQEGEGCRFCGRCQYASKVCQTEKPELVEYSKGRKVRCHQYSIFNESKKGGEGL